MKLSVKVVRKLNNYPFTHHVTTFIIHIHRFAVRLLGIL